METVKIFIQIVDKETSLHYVSKIDFPDGETVLHDPDIEMIDLSKMKDYEDHKAEMYYSDGRKRVGFIHDVDEGEAFLFTDTEEPIFLGQPVHF